jgi:hypothetical protein
MGLEQRNFRGLKGIFPEEIRKGRRIWHGQDSHWAQEDTHPVVFTVKLFEAIENRAVKFLADTSARNCRKLWGLRKKPG